MIGNPDAEGLVEVESAALELRARVKDAGNEAGRRQAHGGTAGLLEAQPSKVLGSKGPGAGGALRVGKAAASFAAPGTRGVPRAPRRVG